MLTETKQKPIEEKFLETGELLIVEFNQGLVVFEVTAWQDMKWEGYTGLPEVDPGGQTNFQRLEDDNGDDILFIEEKNKSLFHVAIGHYPYELQRFTNYPDGRNRLRMHRHIGTPSPGDEYGYIDGDMSPYNTPTDVEELVVVPNTHLTWNFYNPTDVPIQPVLNIRWREYEFRPLDPQKSGDINLIKRAVTPGSPIPRYKAGNFSNQVDFEYGDFWDTKPMGAESLRSLGGGSQ